MAAAGASISSRGAASGSRLIHRQPPPHGGPALLQLDVVRLETLGRERLGAEDERARPVRVPAPAVEGADDLAPEEAARTLQQLSGAMPAGIEEGADPVLTLPDDDDRLIADDVLDEVSDLGDLLQAARHLPGVAPEVLLLELEELTVVVALSRHGEAVLHGERVRPLAVHAFVGHRHRALLSAAVASSSGRQCQNSTLTRISPGGDGVIV